MRPNLYKHMRSLLPAAAEVPRLPQQVWNPHSRQAAARSRQHPDSGPSPRTGISTPPLPPTPNIGPDIRQRTAQTPRHQSIALRSTTEHTPLSVRTQTLRCVHELTSLENVRPKVRTQYSHRTQTIADPATAGCKPRSQRSNQPLSRRIRARFCVPDNKASPCPSGHGSARRRQQHPGSGQRDRAGHSPHAVRPPLQSSRTEQVQNKRIPPPQDSYLTGAGWQNKVGRLLPYAYGRRYLMMTERLAFWCFS